MKQFVYFLLLLLVTSCGGGGFSKGVKKDFTTGLTSSYNGLSVDDIYLADDKGKKMINNQIILGSELIVVASGVDNYKLLNGKAYPGCTIILTDKNSNEILNIPDAFSSLSSGVKASEAAELKATLTTGDPMQVGETYQLYVHFFDKQNVTAGITSSVELLVK